MAARGVVCPLSVKSSLSVREAQGEAEILQLDAERHRLCGHSPEQGARNAPLLGALRMGGERCRVSARHESS